VTDIGTGSTDIETIGDGGGTADQVKDQVRDKAQMAQDKARGAIGQARGRLSDQVDQRSTQAGERIAGTAGDVRSIADQLRNQGKDAPATLAEQLASQADRVGDYLKGASGDRLLRDVEDFARRQPMLVAAAGLALGFAASRFLKASSSRRYQSGPDLLYVEAQPYDAGAATATALPRIPPTRGRTTPPRPPSAKPMWSRRSPGATLRPHKPSRQSPSSPTLPTAGWRRPGPGLLGPWVLLEGGSAAVAGAAAGLPSAWPMGGEVPERGRRSHGNS